MDRKLFLKNGAILAGASLLPIDSVFSQSVQEGGMDKLTDAQGNFAQQPLPYAKNYWKTAICIPFSTCPVELLPGPE